MHRRGHHFARSLAAAVGACVTLAIASTFLFARDPVESFRLDLDELASHTAALALTAEAAADARIYATTRAVQSRQLARRIGDTRQSLSKAEVDGARRNRAVALAERSASLAQQLQAAQEEAVASLATELLATKREIDAFAAALATH